MRHLSPISVEALWAELEKIAESATKTNPGLWESAKREALGKMGGKHSARAMQLATQIYKKKGGGYKGPKPSASTNSLKKWTAQKWKWSGGDKPGQGGRGVYLPEKKVARLKSTEEGRKKLRAAGAKKREATRAGEQYSSHGLAAGTSLTKSAGQRTDEIVNAVKVVATTPPGRKHLQAWSRHSALNLGQAKALLARALRGVDHKGRPTQSLDGVKDAIHSLVFAALPPTHHTEKEMADMLSADHKKWFLFGAGGENPLTKKAFANSFLDELEKISSANPDEIFYGNSALEHVQEMNKKPDRILDWFIKSGHYEQIVSQAPQNSSKATQEDLESLVKKMRSVTAEDLTFARIADSPDQCAQMFLDLLQTHGYESTMGEFFGVDSQVDPLLFSLKDVINRPRPYQLARYFGYPIFPLMRTDAMTASYPSGHALMGFVMGEYYARKFPKIAEKLRALGERIAESREITGIHYPSDTEISRKICEIIFKNNLLRSEN